MRNKKGFSFDEEKDAEEIIDNGFPGRTIDYSAMYTVAKYLRQVKHIGAVRLEKELITFCKAQDVNFNPVTDAESIKKWITSAMNYDLRKIESVTVSEKEIDFLKGIETPRDRKLLFMTLIFSKILKHRGTRHKKTDFKVSDNYYIHYNNFPDIIRFSGLKNISEIDLADILWKYKEHLVIYHAEKELIRVEFVDKNPQKTITIDLQKLCDYYDILLNEKNVNKKDILNICPICGKLFKKNSNRQTVCSDCSKTLTLNRVHKFRDKHRQGKI